MRRPSAHYSGRQLSRETQTCAAVIAPGNGGPHALARASLINVAIDWSWRYMAVYLLSIAFAAHFYVQSRSADRVSVLSQHLNIAWAFNTRHRYLSMREIVLSSTDSTS